MKVTDRTGTHSIAPDALQITESCVEIEEGSGGPVAPDGTILLHIIRPTVGRGKGRHLYEASMLQENATKFSGWKMYVNHLSADAKRKQGGLPRDVRDLGGRIIEAWWDPSVPANDRFGQGAVIGRAKPTPFIRELIENDPEIVEASISAQATGVHESQKDGQTVMVVEGLEDRGSVDWVTEAGAGGRVVSLMEAAIEDDPNGEAALLASLTDDEFANYLRRSRPDLVEALNNTGSEEGTGEEDDMPITPEALAEALVDPKVREVLDSLIDERANAIAEERIAPAVEEAVERERELLRAEADADAARRIQVREMRDQAHGLIREAKSLPEPLADQIRAKYDIVEGRPTDALNLLPDLEEGKITKRAEAKLAEAVQSDIKAARVLLASLNPTHVKGLGVTPEGEIEEGPKDQVIKGSQAGDLLAEAGFTDPDKVWGDPKTLQETATEEPAAA